MIVPYLDPDVFYSEQNKGSMMTENFCQTSEVTSRFELSTKERFWNAVEQCFNDERVKIAFLRTKWILKATGRGERKIQLAFQIQLENTKAKLAHIELVSKLN